jgi:4-amino-4-deoxy-L-arabinose transferase-like glycosyltransferase
MHTLSKHLSNKTRLILFLILLVAGLFRFYNLNWDSGHFFHPDERNIDNAVAAIDFFTQMDPKFYAYGGFLIYLYKATVDLLGFFFQTPSLAKDWTTINLVGRYYSAFFSTMTIIPLFLLARKLFSQKTAFLACLFYALTVSSIQTAHFSITENLLTLLLVLLSYLALLYYEKPTYKLLMTQGILLGIAVATKTTGIPFGLLPAVCFLLLLWHRKQPFPKLFVSGLLLLLITLAVFTLFSPYTFLNWDKFIESMRYENSVAVGTDPVVYTLQFSHTFPYLFQIRNLFWQLGPLMLFALFGLVYFVQNLIRKPKPLLIIFFSFPFLYFLYVGSWYTKFIRYMVPLIPFFLICASLFLTWVQEKKQTVGTILITILYIVTLGWAVAFMYIYTHEQTRITASEWIYSHVPKGSMILTEHWDEGLPVPLDEGSPDQYRGIVLTIYDPDSQQKIDYYANYLSQADYLSITTRRLYGTLIHLPEKYPLTSKYYQLLFSGKLGYEKVAEFPSYPTLFGVTINDDSSEETFQVYDHPKPMIFKNIKHYTFSQIKSILEHAL